MIVTFTSRLTYSEKWDPLHLNIYCPIIQCITGLFLEQIYEIMHSLGFDRSGFSAFLFVNVGDQSYSTSSVKHWIFSIFIGKYNLIESPSIILMLFPLAKSAVSALNAIPYSIKCWLTVLSIFSKQENIQKCLSRNRFSI